MRRLASVRKWRACRLLTRLFPGGLKPPRPNSRTAPSDSAVFVAAGDRPKETLLDERDDAVEDIALGLRTSDGFCRAEREATGKDREAPEERLLLSGKQLIVGKGVLHGALPCRQVSPTAGQEGQRRAGPGSAAGGRT